MRTEPIGVRYLFPDIAEREESGRWRGVGSVWGEAVSPWRG